MNFHNYGEANTQYVRIITVQTVLIDTSTSKKGTLLEEEKGHASYK